MHVDFTKSITTDQVIFTSEAWQIPNSLPYFEGHFPNNPILPAVAIVELSCQFIEHVSKIKVELNSISNAKFLDILVPGDLVEISAAIKTSVENEYYICWKKLSTSKIAAEVYLKINQQGLC